MSGQTQSTVEILIQARNNAQQAFAEFNRQITDLTVNLLKSAEASGSTATAQKEAGVTADATAKAFEKLSNSLSGKTVMDQATLIAKAIDDVGGVSKLTDAELVKVGKTVDQAIDKMKTLGQEVPPAFQAISDAANKTHGPIDDMFSKFTSGIALGVTSGSLLVGAIEKVGSFAMGLAAPALDVINLGETLQDTAYKISSTADETAKLKYVFDVAGGSIEQAGNLLFVMQKQMENSPDKFEKGLKDIGLNIQAIQGLNPVDTFLKVADSFRQNTDQTNRAGAAMDLFSKQGRDAISILMKPLAELNDSLKDTSLYSNDDAQRAEELGMAWRKLKEDASWFGTDIGLKALHFFEVIAASSGTGLPPNRPVPGSPGAGNVFAETVVGNPSARLLLPLGTPPQFGPFATRMTGDPNNPQFDPSLFVSGTTPSLGQSSGFAAVTLDAKEEARAIKILNDELGVHRAQLAEANAAQKALAGAMDALTGVNKNAGEQVKAISALLERGGIIISASDTEFRNLTKTIQALHDEAVPLPAAIDAWYDSTQAMIRAQETLNIHIMDSDELLLALGAGVPVAQVPILSLTDALQQLGGEIDYVKMPGTMGLFTSNIYRVADAANTAGNAITNGLSTALNRLPGFMEHAFEGGGGAAGAAKAFATDFGANIGKEIESPSGPLASILPKSLNNVFGKALGAIGGGLVGSAIGVIGGLLSKIGAPDQAELDSRSDRDSFMKSFQSGPGIDKTTGVFTMGDKTGIQTLADQLMKAGVSGEVAQKQIAALLDAKNPEAFAAAMVPVNAALQHTVDVSTNVSAVQSLVSAYESAGHVIPASMLETINTLKSMPGLTDAEKASLQGLTDSAKPNFQNLEGVAAKYGITLASLGTKFEQGDLNQKFGGVWQDLQDLINAGGDFGSMMASSTTDAAGHVTSLGQTLGGLVNQSKEFGTTIPDNMQPYLAKLVDAGQLTDGAGNKIKSLDGVKFAPSIQTAMDTMNTTLQLLVKTLQGPGSLQDSINQLHGKDVTVNVLANVDPNLLAYNAQSSDPAFMAAGLAARAAHTAWATTGAVGPEPSVPWGFAEGGIVPGVPTGQDTVPVMASPGEMFLNRGEQSVVGRLLAMGGAGTGQQTLEAMRGLLAKILDVLGMSGGAGTTFHNQVVLDGRVIDDRITRVGQDNLSHGAWRVPQRTIAARAY